MSTKTVANKCIVLSTLIWTVAAAGGVRADAAMPTAPAAEPKIDCLPREGIWINIHCKGKRTAREVARKVKAKGRLHQAFMAGREKITRAAREAVPEMSTCLFMTCPSGRGATWTDDDLRAYVDYAARENSQYLQLGDALHDAPAYRDFRARGGKVNYCFGNDAETLKKADALGFDFVLCDDLDAMLPHFPTRFGDAKQATKKPTDPVK